MEEACRTISALEAELAVGRTEQVRLLSVKVGQQHTEIELLHEMLQLEQALLAELGHTMAALSTAVARQHRYPPRRVGGQPHDRKAGRRHALEARLAANEQALVDRECERPYLHGARAQTNHEAITALATDITSVLQALEAWRDGVCGAGAPAQQRKPATAHDPTLVREHAPDPHDQGGTRENRQGHLGHIADVRWP